MTLVRDAVEGPRAVSSRQEVQIAGSVPLTADEREVLVSAWAAVFRAELRAITVGTAGGTDRDGESEAA